MRKGSHHTDASRAKLRVAMTGNQNCLGRELSQEMRAKISTASLGRKLSPETREKLHGPDWRANQRYCARVYEAAWGQVPIEESGRKYNIHHRDGNKHNDSPENLIALTTSEHAVLESALRRGDWDLAAEVDAIGEGRRLCA